MMNFLQPTVLIDWILVEPEKDEDGPVVLPVPLLPVIEIVKPEEGTTGDDTLTGDNNPDQILGNAGNDDIDGKGGDDSLLGGSGGDTIDGGNGNDMIVGGDGYDVLRGGSGDDWIEGGSNTDVIFTGAGADVIHFDADPAEADRSGLGTDLVFGFDLGVDRVSFGDALLEESVADQFVVEPGFGVGATLYAFTAFGELEDIAWFVDLEVAELQAAVDDGSLFV